MKDTSSEIEEGFGSVGEKMTIFHAKNALLIRHPNEDLKTRDIIRNEAFKNRSSGTKWYFRIKIINKTVKNKGSQFVNTFTMYLTPYLVPENVNFVQIVDDSPGSITIGHLDEGAT